MRGASPMTHNPSFRQLIADAQALPWESKSQSRTYGRFIQSGPSEKFPRGAKVGQIDNVHDAALVVAAVNALPDLLDALEGITQTVYSQDAPLDSPSYSALHLECVRLAREALAKVRNAT